MPPKAYPFQLGILLSGMLLVLAAGLTACGGEPSFSNATQTAGGKPSGTPVPVSLVSPTPRPLSQPKIRQSATGPRGTIEFTEVPDLNDGWPSFLWFDSVSSVFSDQMQPTIRTLKDRYQSQVKFADLDFYEAGTRQLAELFHISSSPSFVIVDRKGQAVRSWVGMVPLAELETTLKQVNGS